MGDYSTFKNGLDIIEALTKRLDRLTGFDSELDNILGGRQHDGGLDGVQFDQQFLANSPGSKTILQEHQYSQTTEYQWTSKLFCDVTSMNNQLIGITNCAPLSNHSFNVNDFSSTWANSNGGDFGPSTSYKKKPTNVPEPNYQKETKTSQIKSHSPWDKSGKFSFDTEIPDSSILRKFLETIDEESDSANRVCQNGEWNSTKVNGDYSDLIFDHDIDWTKASAMLEDTLEQHADLSIVDRSNLMIEQIQHMAHSKILTASKGVPKNGEHHQPILFHFEETVKDIGRNSEETFIQEFPPLLETHAERITKQLNLQPKVSPQPKGTFDSAAENQTFQTSLNPNDDQNKVDNKDNISADLNQDISADLNQDNISVDLNQDNISAVLKGGPSSASVAESEEYFTASECSCTPTPSFQSAVDRESVLSWKSLSDFDYLDRSNLQSVTPGMKNLSELYMTSKSSNNLMDAYQSRLDPFKNAGILFEETDKTQSHKHETGREISVPCTIQESFPTHQKENSFTMLEEVHHKHNLKLSAMEGCTLLTEELRSEYPINPRLDHTTKMTTVDEDFTKNVDKNLAFKDFTRNVEKHLTFNDFIRNVDENLTFNNFDEALTRNFHRDLTENFNKDFTSSFDKDLTRNFENEFTNNIDKDIGNYLVLRDTCDADISTNQSQSLTELITSAINGTRDPNSFSTIEEVKDIQHIKFSPLEGCSFNSQVTTTEFSPHDYLSLSAAREAMTSSEHAILQREHTTDVATLEDYNVHREDSQNEKYGEWMAMYNNEPQDPNSFSTIEEVKDIQHIKFSPLEGCSLNSQVTTTEFSPHDYLSLSATRQAVTSSEHAMLPSDPINSEATKDIVLLANNTMRNESMRDLATLLDEESHSTRSVNLALVPSHGKVHREYEDTLDVDKHRGWNRDEMAVYNPERSQNPNSFSTIEEVKDIQHIKFSPLEGCSFNSQVTTTEFSPRDYLMLHRVEEKANEIEAAN